MHCVLAEYILLHFRLKEPYHAFVRVFLAQMFLDTARFLPYMVEMQKYVDPPLYRFSQRWKNAGRSGPASIYRNSSSASRPCNWD